MISEQHISELMDTLMITKITSGIKRTLVNTVSGNKSIPRSANANYITFPIVVTDDVSKDITMDLAKTIEVKLAYDVKRMLERDIKDGPRDLQYDRIVKYLPIDSDTKAVDTTAMRLLRDEISEEDIGEELMKEALDYVKVRVHENDNEFYSEAHSAVVKERGATPTSIDVEIKYIKGDREIKTATYNMAIKAIPRYVDSDTLRMKLSTYDNKRFYKKFVALTNKEEHFVKDFLLDYDLMKKQAKDAVDKNSIFKDIERKNLLNDMGINKYPFTVFVVSENFVQKLKDSEKIGFYEESGMIMKKLLAMGVFVYNHDTDLINVRYDGDKKFTTYPFDEMAKDTSRYEKELQQLVRLNQ